MTVVDRSGRVVADDCVAGLDTCLEGACFHWRGGICTWRPPQRERRTRGARLRLGAKR